MSGHGGCPVIPNRVQEKAIDQDKPRQNQQDDNGRQCALDKPKNIEKVRDYAGKRQGRNNHGYAGIVPVFYIAKVVDDGQRQRKGTAQLKIARHIAHAFRQMKVKPEQVGEKEKARQNNQQDKNHCHVAVTESWVNTGWPLFFPRPVQHGNLFGGHHRMNFFIIRHGLYFKGFKP